MPTITQIGSELAEIPFGEMLFNVAKGIADSQRALDLASVQTLIDLSKTIVDIIPEVSEVITPFPFQVNISGQAPVTVTGARVEASAANPVQMTALQAGITPNFYQFSEASIQLKMSVQMREVTETDTDGSSHARIVAFGSNVNFRTQNTFSYSVDGSSSVTATIKPIPPPTRLNPATVVVNALTPQPTITITR